MKGFNTKNNSNFFRGSKKPIKKKGSGQGNSSNKNNTVPPVIVDHKMTKK